MSLASQTASVSAAPSSIALEFKHVSKSFTKKGRALNVLDDVNLSIAAGEFVCIVGASGCGKSTLLNIAAGITRPSAGRTLYDGAQVDDVNTQIGYMTQSDNLFPWRTVVRNIGLPLELRRVPRAERARRVAEFVELVGLNGFEKHYPAELSGGMRKRVALARVLIHNPQTLLMDEPFGGLDAQLRVILHQELLSLWLRSRQTVIFVTHDLDEAIALADRVVVMGTRPGRVKVVHTVGLPRDRDVAAVRFAPEFTQAYSFLWEQLRPDIESGEEV